MASIRPMNSGPKTRTSTSASSRQYLISSAEYRKFRGTAMHPAFRIPKYTGSHSRQFIMRMPTFAPRSMPRLRSRLAKRLARRSKSRQLRALR